MSALIQQSNEWLELRKNKIGASDAPVIMHVSPWKTPYQLWEEKLGLKESFSSSAMKRGLEMEESARKAFEKETGLVVFPQVLFHKEHEWMMASLDGIDIEGKNIVEIKCPGKVDHEIALSRRSISHNYNIRWLFVNLTKLIISVTVITHRK